MSSESSVNEKKNDKRLEEAISEDDLQYVKPGLALSEHDKDARVEELAGQFGINHSKLMRKIDICVVPPFCLLYFLAFLDRVNISNAKVYGLEADIGLKGNQFSTCLTVFFIPYVVFEVLSNYCLKLVKPHLWLACMIFLFGIITICVGFVENFGGLVICRLFLGVFESGSFPSIFYIMANFYNKSEAQRRFSIFFSCTCLAGGCAGALAFRIHDLDGLRGHASWRYLYWIEGAFTSGLAFVLYFLVTDFPEQARFLSDNERAFLKKKLEVYAGDSGFEIKQTWADVAHVFKEPLIYLAALAYFCLIVPSYSYAFFAPTIIKLLGYTSMDAQAHSIYPWLCSLGFSIIIAFISDKVGRRLPFALFAAIVAIVGLSMVLAGGDNYHLKYGGCFLTAMGLYTCMPVLVCWVSLNFAGHIRKSVATAFVIGFGNIGGIISSYLFPNGDAPDYKKGLGVNIGFTCLAFVFIILYYLRLVQMNREKQKVEYQDKWNAKNEREKIMGGDLNPLFKYLY